MITTADYLALPPQERWAIIEEHVFERAILRNHITKEPTHRRAGKGCLYKGILEPLPDRDQPNGWWEIVEEMERRDFAVIISNPKVFTNGGRKRVRLVTLTTPKHQQFEAAFLEVGLTVQVAALRAVGFIEG